MDITGILCSPDLMIDNQSAIALINNRMIRDKSKHIEVRFHFIRELILDHKIKTKNVPTQDQLADVFTKPLTQAGMIKFRESVRLI